MSIGRQSASLSLLLALAGCEQGPPVGVRPVPQPAQAPAEDLSQTVREQLDERLDLRALDRLLGTLAPEDRAQLLRSFEDLEQAAQGRADIETRDVTVITHFEDPERQQLLEQTWAPFWSHLPSALLQDLTYPLPGRSLAVIRQPDSTTSRRKEREP